MEVYGVGHSWTSLQSPSRSCSCMLPSGRGQLLKPEATQPGAWCLCSGIRHSNRQSQYSQLPPMGICPKAAPADSAGAVAIWTPTSS